MPKFDLLSRGHDGRRHRRTSRCGGRRPDRAVSNVPATFTTWTCGREWIQGRCETMVPAGGPLKNLVLVNACGSSRFTPYERPTAPRSPQANCVATTDVLVDLIADTGVLAQVKTKASISVDADQVEAVIRHLRVTAVRRGGRNAELSSHSEVNEWTQVDDIRKPLVVVRTKRRRERCWGALTQSATRP